jgi:hypothetical protein
MIGTSTHGYSSKRPISWAGYLNFGRARHAGGDAQTSSQGRRPLSDLDQVINDWRTRGGDKIRGEFQDALAAGR